MPKKFSRGRALLLLAALCLGSPAAFAQTSCPTSVGSLNGWYAMLVSGTTTGTAPAPKYYVGALDFNGAGAFSAQHVLSGAGASGASNGTYLKNADCTLTLTFTLGVGAGQSYTVAVTSSGEVLGIETDASGVASIDLQPQFATPGAPGLNFTLASMNGTFAGSCLGTAGGGFSDLNLFTFANGAVSGTDPYNNGGSFALSNVPYTGTYTVASDGTFSGSLVVVGTPFDYYGVISKSGTEVEYIYSNVASGVATAAFSACTAGLVPVAALTSQTIAFPAIAGQKVGGTVALAATASSGLPVSYTSTTPAVCSIAGSTAALLAAGTCSITASQAGNATYAAALSVSQSFLVTATPGSFTLSARSPSISVTPPFCILFICLFGVPGSDVITVTPVNGFTGTVSFAVSGEPSLIAPSFSPSTVTGGGSTTLIMTPTYSLFPGIAVLQITGASGAGATALTATTTVTLFY